MGLRVCQRACARDFFLAAATELTAPWALRRLALGALLVCATFLWPMFWFGTLHTFTPALPRAPASQ